MEINIKHETLPVCSCVCRMKNTFSSDCDIIVPDSKPDVLKVLQLTAYPKVTNCETRNGHMIVSGNIRFDILYLADDEEKCIKSITSSCEFSNLVRDSNIGENMLTFSDVEVCDLVCNVANCRKLSLKAALCMNVCVYRCSELELITEIEGACTQKETITSDTICAHSVGSAVITESFSIAPDKPAILEILKTDASVTESSLKVIDDKAIIKGCTRITVLYMSESGIDYVQTEVPFAHILEADGIREDMNCEHSARLLDITACPNADADGKVCIIDISTEIEMSVIARKNHSTECVTDAYLPHGCLECSTSPVCVDSTEIILNRDADFKEKVSLPENMPPISTVYRIDARPFIKESTVENGTINISGYAEITMLYLSSDENMPICSYTAKVDFETKTESPGCSITPVTSCKLRNISYIINDERAIELRGSIDVEMQCVRTIETDIVYEAKEAEYTPGQRPSVIVSCVHSGRTLWDIAKEYLVSPEDILAANALENESELNNGAALIIPK